MSRSRLALSLASSIAGFAIALGACSSAPLGATGPNLANAEKRSAPGAEAYKKECAACHGERGEGLSNAPPVIGANALLEYARDKSLSTNPAMSNMANVQAGDTTRPPGAPSRDPFRTAQDVFDYVSTRMPLPKTRAGSLAPEEYWAITNFMLIAHGSAVPEGGITPENASSVAITPK